MSRIWFFCLLTLLFRAPGVNGITYNCINKNTPSSACCSGQITLEPTMTTIGNSAFDGCSGLNGSLIIPSSVRSIGIAAFRSCSGFTGSLTIPSSVASLGYDAFKFCSGFNGPLTIPSSVTIIGTSAFKGCYRLSGSLFIPSSVISIGTNTFYGCPGFTGSLTIPNSVTDIGISAFQGCSGFTSAVTFPNSVTTLGSNAFLSNRCNWITCCENCTLTGAAMCTCDSSCNGVCETTFLPTGTPSPSPTFNPSVVPSLLPSSSPTPFPIRTSATVFGFGVIIGDEAILSSGKAILVDHLQEKRRGKMLPISGVVNSSRVSSASDPPLSFDSILIKWRSVSAVSGIGSWEPSSHTILSIPAGGVLVSWLVSLLSEEIKGFIVRDPISSSYLIHFIEYSNSSSSSSRRLSVSDPGISVSISSNKTLSAQTIKEYLLGVSDQRFYLLNSGLH